MADAARSRTPLPFAGGELRKRRRDWGSTAEEDGVSPGFDDGEASKRRGKPQDVVLRLVVPSRQIGRVIEHQRGHPGHDQDRRCCFRLGARGEAYQRMVHFSGTSEQVAIAKSLVERYIYSQSLPQDSYYDF